MRFVFDLYSAKREIVHEKSFPAVIFYGLFSISMEGGQYSNTIKLKNLFLLIPLLSRAQVSVVYFWPN